MPGKLNLCKSCGESGKKRNRAGLVSQRGAHNLFHINLGGIFSHLQEKPYVPPYSNPDSKNAECASRKIEKKNL